MTENSNTATVTYADILRMPHVPAAFAGSLIGRMSFATTTLAVLLSIARSTGSYAAAGAAVAVFGITNVLIAPRRGRHVDHVGPRRGLLPLAIGYAISLLLLGALTLIHSPGWTLILVAGIAGLFPPPLGASMRVLWANIVSAPAARTRAFSLDGVAEQIIYVLGPLFVGLLVLFAHPSYGLVLSAALALAGSSLLARSHWSPPEHKTAETHASTTRSRPLRQRGIPPMLLALVGTGLAVGTVEVGVPAFATDHHRAALAGVLLGAFSLGGAVGGLLYGRTNWRSQPRHRLLIACTALSAVSAVLILISNTALMGIALFVLGFFLAPAMITAYLLGETLAAPRARTETSVLVTTAVNAGIALGSAVAGIVVDRSGTRTTFAVGAAIAVVCTAFAASRINTMQPLERSENQPAR